MDLLSNVVNKLFQLSEFYSFSNVRRTKKMEEKALEVYGE